MKFIDFFAGIGGFRRGMELAGHECVGFCEFDKYAVGSYTSMHLITGEQRQYLATMKLKQRQKEILKGEYKNGEWYANDVRAISAGDIPRADCWCFGFPCQDISVAGNQVGFAGRRSSLFFAVTKLIRELEEKDRPKYLFIENVKNLLSVNRGGDFAKLLIELDEIGYDAEWQVLNSKDYGVPQNRERVFIVGHFRSRGGREVFPISGATVENSVEPIINIVGNTNPCGHGMNGNIYDTNCLSPTLTTNKGEGCKVAIGIDKSSNSPEVINTANCITAREDRGVSKLKKTGTAIAVLTPDRVEKRQNGRRFKEDGEPMFTLTRADIHGVGIKEATKQGTLKGIRIRKLTPKECFRLQGWSDDYFEKAEFINSNSQLYKQAGNGVTVNVIKAIGERLY